MTLWRMVMVAFASLFLGLVAGIQPVTVVVADEVARVELRLDGVAVADIRSPPWTANVDFGRELEPGRLVAIALDGSSREIGRAEQVINLPRPAAEAEVVVERLGGGRPTVVTVSWESKGAAPIGWSVAFDGLPLEVLDVERFELPPHDDALHFVRVDLQFPDDVTATAEATFGGRYASSVSADLTAVVIEPERRRVDAASLERHLVDRAGPVSLLTVEKGEADVVVVVDPSVSSDLDRMVAHWSRQRSRAGQLQRLQPIDESWRLRFMYPRAQTKRGGAGDYSLFPRTPERSPWDGGFLYHTMWALRAMPTGSPVRLADAVAAATLEAAVGNRRRAVVLILGSRAWDVSQFEPTWVRRYMARVGVPLEVWTTSEEAVGLETAWGEMVDVTSVERLGTAFDRLERRLERQRVAWIDGELLPTEVTVAPGEAHRIAGRVAVPPFEGQDLVVAAERPVVEPPPVEETVRARLVQEDPLADRLERLQRAVEIMGGRASETSAGPWRLVTDIEERPQLLELLARAGEATAAAYEDRYGLVPIAPVTEEIVIVFANGGDYRRYLEDEPEAGGPTRAGHAGGGVAVLAAGQRNREEVAALFLHEVTHLLNRRAAAGELAPWLEEGMATDLGWSRIEGDGEIRLGTLAVGAGSLRYFRTPGGGYVERSGAGPLAALENLLAVRRRGAAPSLGELLDLEADAFLAESTDLPLRYATSGYFVRFLFDGQRGRWRDAFLQFLAAVSAGGPSDGEALEAALGTDLASLEPELDGYLGFTLATSRIGN